MVHLLTYILLIPVRHRCTTEEPTSSAEYLQSGSHTSYLRHSPAGTLSHQRKPLVLHGEKSLQLSGHQRQSAVSQDSTISSIRQVSLASLMTLYICIETLKPRLTRLSSPAAPTLITTAQTIRSHSTRTRHAVTHPPPIPAPAVTASSATVLRPHSAVPLHHTTLTSPRMTE